MAITLSSTGAGRIAARDQEIDRSGVFRVSETNYDTPRPEGTSTEAVINIWTISSTTAAPAVLEPTNASLLLAVWGCR